MDKESGFGNSESFSLIFPHTLLFMKLDLLVLAAHPDDAELCCAGTILSFTAQGKKAGIVDLTRGELGTRGTIEDRAAEAAEAAQILGLSVRENLGLADGFFEEEKDSLLKIISVIRRYQPDIVLTNALYDRHPDHGRGGNLVSRACFLSGLSKIETLDDHNSTQEPWRPSRVYHFIQDRYIKPDFVVDISNFWLQKAQAIRAFKTQFYTPDMDGGPQTYISTPEFFTFIEARALELGHSIGARYGEGFNTDQGRHIGIRDLSQLL